MILCILKHFATQSVRSQKSGSPSPMLITRISRDTFIGNGNGMDENGEKRVILWPRTDADKGIKFVSAIKSPATSLSIWPITQIKVHTLLEKNGTCQSAGKCSAVQGCEVAH